KEFLAEPRDEIDEAALGIDGEGYDINRRFAQIGCRLENIFHVGAMSVDHDLPESLEEMIGDLAYNRDSLIFKDLPFLKAMFACAKKHREDPQQLFSETSYDEGIFGFIVLVSIPEHRPHADGKGASVHMSTRYTECRYGSTFKVACDRAAEWAEAKYKQMMAQPIAA